jgi:glycosyltransferase involved in cell wall biosynthesis
VNDVRDLMLQLYWTITHPKERAKAGKLAKEYVHNFYRWDDVARETARLYTSLAPLTETSKRVKTNATVPLSALRRA